MIELAIITGTLAVANGTFTLATSFWKLRSVDNDLKICLRLLGMITQDINEARQLRNRKRKCMSKGLLARTERAIEELDAAAKAIGKMLEASRVQKAVKNSISIATRFAWVFDGKENFLAEQWAVNAAHSRLLQVITSMDALPDAQTDSPAPLATYEKAVLRSPSQLRALEGKSTAIIEKAPPAYESVAVQSPSQHQVLKAKRTVVSVTKELKARGTFHRFTCSNIYVNLKATAKSAMLRASQMSLDGTFTELASRFSTNQEQ